MFSAYALLKLVHVVAAMIWVGGGFALTLLNVRMSRLQDREGMAVLARQGEFLGKVVFGPSALLTLLAGIGLVVLAGSGLVFWTVWGLVGVFGSLLLGAILIARANLELGAILATPSGDVARAAVLRGRLGLYGVLNLTLLFSTVVVMVLKPTL